MKKIKNILILLIIILIILSIVTVILIKKGKGEEIKETPEAIEIMKNETDESGADKLVDAEEYLEIRECANLYLTAINIDNSSYYGYDDSGNYVSLISEEDTNSAMMNVLSEEYVNKNHININNIRNYVYKIEEECFFIPINVVKKNNNDNIKSFGVYGVIVTQDYIPVTESYIIVNIDESNNTFSIEQVNNDEELSSVNANLPDEITKNDNNIFSEEGVIYEDLITAYINDYKRLALSYPEIVYNNFLDNEYKNKRFENLEAYKNYILDNKKLIESITLTNYQVLNQEGYTQYISKDENNNYYIFNSKTASDYNIILDNYTIDLPEFIEKYNSGTDQQKVALNIDKFIQAINAKDYKYAYNCLADSFKNNYFKTQADFENYAKENFYSSNTVGYNQFDTQGEYYTYSIVLTNKETKETMNKTFIMQLGEGTEFKLSFDR